MLKLVIGNKNYSSWSMRPWLALRANDIPFEEVLIPLYTDNPADKQRILSFSAMPARCRRWSMATSRCGIRFRSSNISPRNSRRAKLWPEDRAARAHARSISAEMHSGFMALRNECGMNLHRPVRAVALSDDAQANVARIQAIWAECHQRYGKDGPFLFGAFCGADAMFAPVVHRFRTYAIPVATEARHYVDAMDALPAFREWTRDGLAETLLIDRLEAV